MSKFKQYARILESRKITSREIEYFKKTGCLYDKLDKNNKPTNKSRMIKISKSDIESGHPKTGDIITRDPLNKSDQWLITKKYFKTNFLKCEDLSDYHFIDMDY